MTNEEFESQMAKTREQIRILLQTHVEFKQSVRNFIEEQRELNQSLREMVRALTVSQARANERLDNLESESS